MLKDFEYRSDIDGLRAIAILSVVGYHAFPGRMPGGYIGVDIFFVISGFLISGIVLSKLQNRTFSLVEFFSRRVCRIFPGLIVVLATCLVVGWYILPADEYRQLGKHVSAGSIFIQNFILWRESGYFDNVAASKPLLHLWSLSIEEQFYIFWPLVLWLVWKQQRRLLTAIASIGAVSFAIGIVLVEHNQSAAYYSPISRFWELMLGGLLAHISLNRPDILANYRSARSISGFALLVAGFVLIDKRSAFPGWWALLPTLGAFFVISAGREACLNRIVLSNRAMVWVGLISYPLYLWHWPLLSFSEIAIRTTPTPTGKVLCVAGAVVLAWVTYKYVETPIRRSSGEASRKTLPLLALMTTFGVVGLIALATNGLFLRTPSELDKQGYANFEWGTFARENICHLDDPQLSHFEPACVESKRPLVALWGDSAAASLYPGFKELQARSDFGVAQTTQSACMPILRQENPAYRKLCGEVNAAIVQSFDRIRPDIIVMHSTWGAEIDEGTEINIRYTLRELSRIKGARVVIIGPPPHWRKSPRRTAYEAATKEGSTENVSSAFPMLQPADLPKEIDGVLRRLSREENVDYISAIDILCEGENCISRVGDSPTDWIAWDDVHLSKAGAEFLVARMARSILGAP